jgi:two-component system sensor histidine kinase PhoQ
LAEQPELRQQLDRIAAMIEHQLKRASSSGQDVWHKKIAIAPLVEPLQQALQKIYRDKNIVIRLDIPEGASFRGDEADLIEMLGNLMDNACKACQRQVALHVQLKPLQFMVTDDGPGIAPEHRQQLLQRGTRLDTYKEGHGVGLSIVDELVKSYSGRLEIGTADLGGAAFTLHFPEHQY